MVIAHLKILVDKINQLKKNGVPHVDSIQKNTYFTVLNVLRILVFIKLT